MSTLTAERVLEMCFISYATPLALARRWLQSIDKSQQGEARKLLEGLFERFPHSIEIGQQLALAYLEGQDEDKARSVVGKLSLLCRNPNEEILSRCGRIYRDNGDRYVKLPEIGGQIESPPDAVRYYRLALEEYTKAYRIRSCHYPGINVATLHLLIGAFESNEAERAANLKASKSTAETLLDRRANWPLEVDEDPVWHLATAGEANLLRHRWEDAAECYRAAQRHRMFQPRHRESMRKQVLRIVYCHRRLGTTSLGAFDDLPGLFPSPESLASQAQDA